MKQTPIIDMCKKLHAVAFQATGNESEKATAQKHLRKLMEAHGLSLSDIDPEAVEWVRFRYSAPWEQKLYVSIYSKVARRKVYKAVSKNRYLWFKCTAAQEIEIGRLFNRYKSAFVAEIEKLTSAFIMQNQIFNFDEFVDEDEAADVPVANNKEHDAFDIEAILAMAAGMSEVSINEEIEHEG